MHERPFSQRNSGRSGARGASKAGSTRKRWSRAAARGVAIFPSRRILYRPNVRAEYSTDDVELKPGGISDDGRPDDNRRDGAATRLLDCWRGVYTEDSDRGKGGRQVRQMRRFCERGGKGEKICGVGSRKRGRCSMRGGEALADPYGGIARLEAGRNNRWRRRLVVTTLEEEPEAFVREPWARKEVQLVLPRRGPGRVTDNTGRCWACWSISGESCLERSPSGLVAGR